MNDVISKRLKSEREKRKSKDPKWTQGYVADCIGVARVTYTAYENGTKQPPLETVNKIADLLGLSTDFLLGRTDDPKPNVIRESRNFAYYGGGEDLTEEEVEIARLAVEAFRKGKKSRDNQKN